MYEPEGRNCVGCCLGLQPEMSGAHHLHASTCLSSGFRVQVACQWETCQQRSAPPCLVAQAAHHLPTRQARSSLGTKPASPSLHQRGVYGSGAHRLLPSIAQAWHARDVSGVGLCCTLPAQGLTGEHPWASATDTCRTDPAAPARPWAAAAQLPPLGQGLRVAQQIRQAPDD